MAEALPRGLMDCHIPFIIMDIWPMDLVRMKTYKTVILPGASTDGAADGYSGKYVERAEVTCEEEDRCRN